MIPKILHQTWSSASLPDSIAQGVRQLRDSNPDWEYRFYDDDAVAAFIKKRCSAEIQRAFFRINPDYGPSRADLFRYLLMYRYGGVYLDIKSSTTRPLSATIREDDRFLLAQWPNGPGQRFATYGIHPELNMLRRGEFQQWHVICERGHPYLAAVIARVIRNIDNYDVARDGVGMVGVLRVTGPIAYTLAIVSKFDPALHCVAATHEHLGLLYSTVGSQGGIQLHKGLLAKRHYSTLTDPVVKAENGA